MEIDRMELGALIRKRRKELGLTLNDLARDDISTPTLSNIERGTVYKVSEDKLSYIMNRLGLTDESLAVIQQQSQEEQLDFTARLSEARHLIQLKLYDEARKELNALEREEGIDDYPYHSMSVQLQKGILFRKLEQWERAKRTLQNVVRLAQDSNVKSKHSLIAEAYYYLSLCSFFGDQNYEQAIEYADSALDVLQDDEEWLFLKGQILHDKATYYYHLERYGSAYKYVMEAQTISEQVHDIRFLILEYNLEGLILTKQQMYKNAIRTFEKAIALSRKFYFVPETASLLYLNLGDTYYRAESFDKAIHSLNIAYKLCLMTKDQNMRGIVYLMYGEVYYEMKEFDRANTYVNKATELAKKFTITSEYLQLLVLKAKICLDTGSAEIKNACREGIQLAEKTRLYDKKKEFHYILAKYYDQQGKREQFVQETENIFHVEGLIKGGK